MIGLDISPRLSPSSRKRSAMLAAISTGFPLWVAGLNSQAWAEATAGSRNASSVEPT